VFRLLCCVVTVLCLLVAGCGGDEESKPEPAGASKRTGGYTGAKAIAHDVARVACGDRSPRQTATDLGLPPTANESTVAEKYSKSFPSEQRQPAIEGCLAGLRAP
jgi:hypothetical protein